MSDKFISEGILSRVVLMNQDSKKRKRFVTDLNTRNDKNDLYYVFKTAEIENIDLSSSCIYTDINETRQNLSLKLIFAINNL